MKIKKTEEKPIGMALLVFSGIVIIVTAGIVGFLQLLNFILK